MKNEQDKKIIIELLQTALTGQLKTDSSVNPQYIADAIIKKIKFNSSFIENPKEIIETIIENVNDCKDELEQEFESLDSESEKLLRNFIRGKLAAYQEFLDIFNKLI